MLLTKAMGEQSRESLNALNMLRALAPAAAASASTVIGPLLVYLNFGHAGASH